MTGELILQIPDRIDDGQTRQAKLCLSLLAKTHLALAAPNMGNVVTGNQRSPSVCIQNEATYVHTQGRALRDSMSDPTSSNKVCSI